MTKKVKSLQGILEEKGPGKRLSFSDGAVINPAYFPMECLEVEGSVLFADLPGYSLKCRKLSNSESVFLTNHYFAWMEGTSIMQFNGIIDKFIGDEIMVVFINEDNSTNSLEAALKTAKVMIERDPFAFQPRIGIASGSFTVARVGTESVNFVSSIGHTVNLAARCTDGPNRRIRTATNDIGLIKKIFIEDYWIIKGPHKEDLKNMPITEVIDIESKHLYVPGFDYYKWIKEDVKEARQKGVIKSLYSTGQ